jgi:hypothetical protein
MISLGFRLFLLLPLFYDKLLLNSRCRVRWRCDTVISLSCSVYIMLHGKCYVSFCLTIWLLNKVEHLQFQLSVLFLFISWITRWLYFSEFVSFYMKNEKVSRFRRSRSGLPLCLVGKKLTKDELIEFFISQHILDDRYLYLDDPLINASILPHEPSVRFTKTVTGRISYAPIVVSYH